MAGEEAGAAGDVERPRRRQRRASSAISRCTSSCQPGRSRRANRPVPSHQSSYSRARAARSSRASARRRRSCVEMLAAAAGQHARLRVDPPELLQVGDAQWHRRRRLRHLALGVERLGAGAPSGLQNRHAVVARRWVGSIPAPLRSRRFGSTAGVSAFSFGSTRRGAWVSRGQAVGAPTGRSFPRLSLRGWSATGRQAPACPPTWPISGAAAVKIEPVRAERSESRSGPLDGRRVAELSEPWLRATTCA